MRIILEGRDEILKKLERINELSRLLYREIGALPPLIDIKYTPEENTACDGDTDGELIGRKRRDHDE